MVVDNLPSDSPAFCEKEQLLNGDIQCWEQCKSVWMVDDSRPDWAVTQEELRAMRNCAITNYMDGSVDIEYAMCQQMGMTEEWKVQR